MCDPGHLNTELNHISHVLSKNGYPKTIIERTIKERKFKAKSPSASTENYKDTYKHWVTLDFIPKVSYKLRAILNKEGIGVRFSSGSTLKNILCKLKTPLPFSLTRNCIYKIPCKDPCNMPYVGLTSQHIKSRITQHMRDLNPNKPLEEIVHATAYHERSTGHHIDWEDVEILDTAKYPWLLPYKESIAISKYTAGPPKGINRDWGHKMSHIWKALYKKVQYNPKTNH